MVFKTLGNEEKLFYQIMLETDEKLIYDTFKNHEYGTVREAVVNKLSDEKLIYDSFKEDEEGFVREAVVKSLSDEKLLAYFNNDSDSDVRCLVNLKLK